MLCCTKQKSRRVRGQPAYFLWRPKSFPLQRTYEMRDVRCSRRWRFKSWYSAWWC